MISPFDCCTNNWVHVGNVRQRCGICNSKSTMLCDSCFLEYVDKFSICNTCGKLYCSECMEVTNCCMYKVENCKNCSK